MVCVMGEHGTADHVLTLSAVIFQLTADKKVVVFHDEDLKRICGKNIKVSDLTYEELSTASLRYQYKERTPAIVYDYEKDKEW